MSRSLSELLGALELSFHQNIRQLEHGHGNPGHDIRLSVEVNRAVRGKIRELGLDPDDTTGQELYAALKQRLKADDQRLKTALQTKFGDMNGDEADIVPNIARALQKVPISKSCFGLKSTAAKAILKKNPPKRTMKQLGYRSLESMVKHEPVACLFAAAWLAESATWQHNILDDYKQLRPNDFEVRDMDILHPASERWQKLAQDAVSYHKNNVVSLKELGAVVLLPLPEGYPPVAATTAIASALHAMNEIRATSTYLKLCQVKPDFGAIVRAVVSDEPRLQASLLGQPVAWQVVQRYYSRFVHLLNTDIFEPHVQSDDLYWHSIEKVLSFIEPSLEFWHDTAHLGFLHDHQAVSLNIIDVALSCCNQLPYKDRILHYFRHSLWHELTIRYLKHEQIEQSVTMQLEPEFATEPAMEEEKIAA